MTMKRINKNIIIKTVICENFEINITFYIKKYKIILMYKCLI